MSNLDELKQEIWIKCKRSLALVQSAADKAAVSLPVTSIEQAEAIIKALTPKRKTPKPTLSDEHKKRYIDAYYAYQAKEFPNWVKDGHALQAEIPNTGEANGLTNFICLYIMWTGGRATRISSAGRKLPDGKFIPGTTRNGSSDISSTIKGKSVMFEVKVKQDKPSPAQLKEQARERKAGGEYFFTHNVDEFFRQYDSVSREITIFD